MWSVRKTGRAKPRQCPNCSFRLVWIPNGMVCNKCGWQYYLRKGYNPYTEKEDEAYEAKKQERKALRAARTPPDAGNECRS